jgi:beta-lactamase regulating signal transducer with metallopeptidase domain
MTAWTVVLMASLSMPVLMHWATVPIAAGTSPPDIVIAPLSPAATTRATVPPTEFPSEKMDPASAPEGAGVAARSHELSSADSPLAAIDWPALAMGLYFAVCAGLLSRLAIGLALTWRLLRRGRRINANWTAGLDVRLSAAIATPVTFGTTILLPADCLDWSPMKRQAVLAHERSHVVRGDFHVLLLATLHRALFWFSPFSWWLLNELAETAELISDDAAIEILGDRPCYAEILLDVAGSARQITAGIGMARTRSAMKRVEHILAADVPPPRLDRGGHRFSGPGACLEPPAKLARRIAEKIRLVHTYFPRAQIGTADLVDESRSWIDELAEWTDVYQRVTGEPLAFFMPTWRGLTRPSGIWPHWRVL